MIQNENEQKDESMKIKSIEKAKIELDEEEDKQTEIIDLLETKENEDSRFKPKVKLNIKKQRYPYCIVWTPIPCFTWIFPSIGHVGICNSKGIIHDYSGPYYVSIDDMAFGNPSKYVLLDLNSRELDEYDNAIEEGTKDYNRKFYCFCYNNCHSFVARCLNKLKYKGKTNYTMIHIWWMICIKGKFLSFNKCLQTYLIFLIMMIILFGLYFLFSY